MSEMPAPPRGCPDPSVLAAFVEGTLDAQTRRDVERHVADCPECPGVIAETARFLEAGVDEAEGEPDPPPGRQWWWLTAAAFAALCTLGAWQFVVNRDPLRHVKQIASECAVRPVEGQLVGFGYAPLSLPRAGRKPAVDLALRAEAERLTSFHARGVALLLLGNVNAAVPSLERATRLTPDDAEVWSDLAAARIAAREFSRALTAADRAVALAPSLAAAHFNRALALEYLGRRDEAIRAYQRAMNLDPRWREEIASRIEQLQP
jgi:tetratricopeptide (TPR) repeat protein